MARSLTLALALNSIATSSAGGGVPAWMASVKNGSDSATSQQVVLLSDSTGIGIASSDAGNNTNAFPNSPPVVMAALAVADGFKARADAWANGVCGLSTTALATAYRPGLAQGSWIIRGLSGMSTRIMRDNIGAGAFTLDTGVAFNALVAYGIVEAVGSTAQYSVTVDGNIVSTVSGSTSSTPPGVGGSPRQVATTITGLTKKVQQIAFNRVASDVNVTALIPYNTDESELIFVPISASGMSTTNAVELNNTTPSPRDYTMGNSGTYLPRAATIVCLGINDMLAGLSLATFEANLAAIDANHGTVVRQLRYDGQTGEFTAGRTVTGGTSGATGVIKRVEDVSATGRLMLTSVVGTFQDNETITDGLTGSAAANGVDTPFNGGRLLWCVPHYIDPVQVATVTQELYHDAIRAQALATGRRLLDFTAKFGSHADMVSNGDMSPDGVHLPKQGSAKRAAWEWADLKTVA